MRIVYHVGQLVIASIKTSSVKKDSVTESETCRVASERTKCEFLCSVVRKNVQDSPRDEQPN